MGRVLAAIGERLEWGESPPRVIHLFAMANPSSTRSLEPTANLLSILNEIARIATEDLELQPMLQRITDALARSFGWEFVALVRVDEDSRRFVCEAVTSSLPSEIYPGYQRPFGSGVVGEVAATGEPIVLGDVREVPNFVQTLDGCRSELCVPVRHRGRVVALLNVESTRPNAFEGQLPLVETVAEQIAGAIHSARAFEALRRRASSLEILGRVSKTALAAGDLNTLLHRVAEFAYEEFGVAAAVLLLEDEEHYRLAARAAPFQIEATLGTTWPIDAGIVGRALRTGEVQYLPDVETDPEYRRYGPTPRAELVVPILFRGRTLGAFNFESDDPRVFSEENRAVLELIAERIAGAIDLAHVNQKLKLATAQLGAANARLREQSLRDALTGTANRRGFDEALEQEWRRAHRRGVPLALALFDIDRFKALNDAYGHPHGDACLRSVAAALEQGARRASDLLARYGGEEFALLLPGVELQAAKDLAEELCFAVKNLNLEHRESDVATCVTVSAGVAAVVPSDEARPSSLIAAADLALYRAKRGGRNRTEALEPVPIPGDD